eukprot:6993669-Heterocapsa_arctica.AAC.1
MELGRKSEGKGLPRKRIRRDHIDVEILESDEERHLGGNHEEQNEEICMCIVPGKEVRKRAMQNAESQ